MIRDVKQSAVFAFDLTCNRWKTNTKCNWEMQTWLLKWVSFRKKALSPLFWLGVTKQTKQRSPRRCDLGSIPFEPWRQQPEQIGLLCAAWQQAPNDRLSIWTAWSHTLMCSCLWAALLHSVHARPHLSFTHSTDYMCGVLHWGNLRLFTPSLHQANPQQLLLLLLLLLSRCHPKLQRVSMRQRGKGISKDLRGRVLRPAAQ